MSEDEDMTQRFYGDAGLGRNPEVGSPVRLRQSPDVLGRIVERKLDTTGAFIWRVEWFSGPVPTSWHPAEGLLVAEDVS